MAQTDACERSKIKFSICHQGFDWLKMTYSTRSKDDSLSNHQKIWTRIGGFKAASHTFWHPLSSDRWNLRYTRTQRGIWSIDYIGRNCGGYQYDMGTTSSHKEGCTQSVGGFPSHIWKQNLKQEALDLYFLKKWISKNWKFMGPCNTSLTSTAVFTPKWTNSKLLSITYTIPCKVYVYDKGINH